MSFGFRLRKNSVRLPRLQLIRLDDRNLTLIKRPGFLYYEYRMLDIIN